MSNNNKYGSFRNKNNYMQKGVVVFKFEEVEVNGAKQIYATGFDLNNPSQMVSIALMNEEGYRKNIAQIHHGYTEKTDGYITKTFSVKRDKDPHVPLDEYKKILHHPELVEREYGILKKQRKNAQTLLTKRALIAKLPAVLMFDNANKIGELGDIQVYEARWVSGLSSNTPSITPKTESEINSIISEDMALEQILTTSHRKVLANLQVKYDGTTPVWADLNAVDRIENVKVPSIKNSDEENLSIQDYNRRLITHSLANKTISSNGFSSERKPFTYFNLLDKNGTHVDTVRVITEEFAASRIKDGDPTQEHNFKKPKSPAETIQAYFYHQDVLSLPLKEMISKNEPLSIADKRIIDNAHKADKARSVISAMMGYEFSPLITSDLCERAKDPIIEKELAIKANELKSFHKKLITGELSPRMVNGTVFALGTQYLKRLDSEMQPTSRDKLRPISGVMNMVEMYDENGEKLNKHKIVGHTEDKKLIFSEFYISPQKRVPTDPDSSVFTTLLTTPHQSAKAAKEAQLTHDKLDVTHAPTAESVRFIEVEYADYISGKKEIPSLGEYLAEEKSRVLSLEKNAENKHEYDALYRMLGQEYITPKGAETPKSNTSSTPQNDKTKDFSPGYTL